MPTTLFTWGPVVECSVEQDYLESQPHYSSDYQLINTEAISGIHKAMHVVMVSQLSRLVYKPVLNYNSVMFF